MKILVIKLSSLGDIVHAIPSVNLIKTLYPGSQIEWLVHEKFTDLLERQNSIDKIHTLQYKTISALWVKAKELKAENYDLVIDMQGLIKTALTAKLIGAPVLGFKQPREKIASWLYDFKADLGYVLDNKTHIIEKNLELALEICKRDVSKRLPNKLEFNYGNLGPKTISIKPSPETFSRACLIPSTTWDSKFWLPEYWCSTISNLIQKHKSEIFILGTQQDLPNIEPIITILKANPAINFYLNGEEQLNRPNAIYKVNIVSCLKLVELPDFFRSMDLVIGVDTGPLHIAAASAYVCGDIEIDSDKNIINIEHQTLPIKIIGLFGPTSGARTGPFGFQYLSADEITGEVAGHKKNDDSMAQAIKPENLSKLAGIL